MEAERAGCSAGLLYPLGRTGAMVREGIGTKVALRKAKTSASRQGGSVLSGWHKTNRKATLYILGPIFGWPIVYMIVFRLLQQIQAPTGVYILILLPMIPVVLGVMGLVFKPMEDEGEYLPIFEDEREAERVQEVVSKIVGKINLSIISGDPVAIKDQVALLHFVDNCMMSNHHDKPNDRARLRRSYLEQLYQEIYTHIVSALAEKDRQALNKLLDQLPSNQEMDRFLMQRIPDMETKIAGAMLKFRDTHFPLSGQSQQSGIG
jgi:hypothetical protein